MIPPKPSVLASVGAKAFVGASHITAKEPAAAVGRGTADGVNEADDFSGESLPDCSA